MNYSQYSLERYKILVYGLGKNLKKKIEVPVHMSKGKMKRKKSRVTPGGQATPLKTGVWVIIRGLSDPLG